MEKMSQHSVISQKEFLYKKKPGIISVSEVIKKEPPPLLLEVKKAINEKRIGKREK